MFTGIIEEKGIVRQVHQGQNSGSITIAAEKVLQDVQLGDSIAVNGVCLTVTSFTYNQFTADVMPITLKKTNLGQLSPGKEVNLERALQIHSRLGGHLVSGHIDCTGTIIEYTQDENAIRFEVEIPENLKDYIIPQGSIAIDGISLTLAELTDSGFIVSIIPHTAEMTTLANRKNGDQVNLESDMVGKYLYHFWKRSNQSTDDDKQQKPNSRITKDFLIGKGYL